jgi:hypothetical protein
MDNHAHGPKSRGRRPAMPIAARPPSRVSDPADRRSEPRHTSLEYRAWLGWMEQLVYRTADARLLDIGRAGALVETSALLSVDQAVLLALVEGHPDGGVHAAVRRVTTGRRHRHRVHLAFTEPCPGALLEGAIEGLPRPRQRLPR